MASRTYNVLKKTLNRLDGVNTNTDVHVQAFGRSADFPKEILELSKYALLLEEGFSGLTSTDLWNLARQAAEANSLPHCFNRENRG